MRLDPDTLSMLTTIGFMMAIAGMLLLLYFPKSDQRQARAFAVFVGGVVILAYTFIVEEPDFIQLLRDHIALTVIGMVIVTLNVIKMLRN